jgi:ADP-dependent NAD(P)H-hydrate dehydratase
MSTPEATAVTPGLLRAWPLPPPGSDKEERGRLVVAGGTTTTPGACLLAAEAGLRAGAGKLAVATAGPVAVAAAVALPEASVTGLPVDEHGNLAADAAEELFGLLEGADAALVGSGFRSAEASVALLERVLPRLDTAVVLDAVGSAYLTEHEDGLRHLGGAAVLSVNPSELARVSGAGPDDVGREPLSHAVALAGRCEVVVLCGGEDKYVAAPDGQAWVVTGGGPGLGVSGSGDVQAGIVAGLLARGAEPAQAAVWGGYVHARCGDRRAAAVATVGYLARELPAEVPAVLRELG